MEKRKEEKLTFLNLLTLWDFYLNNQTKHFIFGENLISQVFNRL